MAESLVSEQGLDQVEYFPEEESDGQVECTAEQEKCNIGEELAEFVHGRHLL